jgi:putative AbiEii toxin of type IV toxin-antitoxin system
MATSILGEILLWSNTRPAWQRDALRRIFAAGDVTVPDLSELVALCKAAHGLSEPAEPDMLAERHLPISGSRTDAVSLVSMTHHRGVNALAFEQTVTFGPNLTVIYGQNTAGKSGYTRILKRACRSRFTEEILGNVLSGEAPLKPLVTILFRIGTDETELAWTPEATLSDALAAVSVFDAHCAPVYLRDKTDVAFRPFALDVFDTLSDVCGQVRARLEAESSQLKAAPSRLPDLPEGTRARTVVNTLTELTKVDGVRALAVLSQAEEKRLGQLRERQRDLQAADPKRRASDLRLKADRIDLVVRHLSRLRTVLNDAALAAIRSTAESREVARKALAILRTTTFTPDVLPGTGDDKWRTMWDAAAAFATVAYPGSPFPGFGADARCPLCQQPIGPDAEARLEHFREYVESTARAEVRSAEAAYVVTVAPTTGAVVLRDDVELAVSELTVDDADLGGRVVAFLEGAVRIQDDVKSAITQRGPLPVNGLDVGPDADLRSAAEALRDRAAKLHAQTTAMEPDAAAELRELESRVVLREHLDIVESEIERLKRLAAYKQCIDDTSTQAITRKSTELTKRLVTEQLQTAFQDELAKLEFKHLAVAIQPAGGARGELFHHLVFPNAPGVAVTSVLSDGESRTLSLASFLTELSTAASRSAIIFDDPVSSLDHMWRERIARRLVREAKGRQVIVFTHEILFLRYLLDEATRHDVPCNRQYVRREGQAGVSSAELPWIAMGIRDRIGALRLRWQAADKTFRATGSDAYERDAREIYGLLREAWEQAISEVLLNDVVERYRHSIETRRVRYLHDITEADCRAVEDAMTECSRWIRGHDQPAADAAPVPQPAEIKRRIDDLDGWVQSIRKRRD